MNRVRSWIYTYIKYRFRPPSLNLSPFNTRSHEQFIIFPNSNILICAMKITVDLLLELLLELDYVKYI